ncbi:hypothetical protein YC2023_007011 [Brassica napus]
MGLSSEINHHCIMERMLLIREEYDVRRKQVKTEPPSHLRGTDWIHTVVSLEPWEKLHIEVIWVLVDHGDVIPCVGRRPVHWVWCMLWHSLVDLLCQGFEVDKSSTDVCYRAHIRWCFWSVSGQRVCTSL